jgi:pilus assembly protein CpaE
MQASELTLGVLATSPEERDLLRSLVRVVGLGSLEVEVDQYCATRVDRQTLQFIEARPDVVIVDMADPAVTIQALAILHAVLPECWLLVSSSVNDPELIIQAMRAGAREYLLKPLPPAALSQALRRYLAEKEQSQKKGRAGEIYCVSSAKGGSGTTSLTLNLASALADLPNTRVALLDLSSPVGDAAAYLNLTPRFTATDALEAAGRLDSVLLESYMTHTQGLAVLPGPKEFRAELPPGVGDHATDPSGLARLLDVVTHTYSHALVDLSPAIDKDLLRLVLEMATRVVIVLTPELPALWRTQRLFGFLQGCGGAEKVRLVLNRSRRSDMISDREIEKTLQHPVFWQLPNDYQACIEAINNGRPLVSSNHSELARSYRELAHRLSGIPLPEKRGGLLGLLSPKARRPHGGRQVP